MTVDQMQMQPMNNMIQELNQREAPQMNVQQELQKDVMKEASGVNQNSTQKQLLQMMATAQPLNQIQQTAQQQIERGELDIRV